MEKITPFKNAEEAIASLDNGGRFYNIFTHANDQVITEAEVGKVAGMFADKQQSILFFELATQLLDETSKAAVIAQFDEKLQASYEQFKPVPFAAATVSNNVIMQGIPHHVDSKMKFTGFMMVPVGTVFTMIPLAHYYEAYELRNEQGEELMMIAHKKGKEKLPARPITLAGVMKEMKDMDKTTEGQFVEVSYYVE
ncbi:hypothetical protein [Chitinophaga skermanii]|nr:hypothetical protein [Chitinophaga skermanii]